MIMMDGNQHCVVLLVSLLHVSVQGCPLWAAEIGESVWWHTPASGSRVKPQSVALTSLLLSTTSCRFHAACFSPHQCQELVSSLHMVWPSSWARNDGTQGTYVSLEEVAWTSSFITPRPVFLTCVLPSHMFCEHFVSGGGCFSPVWSLWTFSVSPHVMRIRASCLS